jgi:hypothetical protein
MTFNRQITYVFGQLCLPRKQSHASDYWFTFCEQVWHNAGRCVYRWQRAQLPDAIRELVLDDQRLRNEVCWCVYEC